MAIKYRLEFYGRTDKHHKVEINIPSYEGNVIPLTGVEGSALQLNWNGDENIFDAHVIGSQLEMSVYDEGNMDLDELMLTPDLEYQVNYYIDDSLFWRGYLISDGVQESLIIGGEVKLTAVDGMNSMEGIDFKFTNPPAIQMPNYVSAIRCPLNVIKQAFDVVDNLLPINFMLSTNLDGFNVLSGLVEFSPRGEIVTMKKYDTYEIFEGILKSVNCHCIQAYGEWWIVNVLDLRANNGIFNGYKLVDNTALNRVIDLNIMLEDINSSGVRMVNKPISKVIVKYEGTTEENIIPNGNLNARSFGAPLYWFAQNGDLTDYESINGRSTDVYGQPELALSYQSMGSDNYLSFRSSIGKDYIMVDSKVLHTRFVVGFTLMPKDYPTKVVDGQTLIDWLGQKPLKMELSFTRMDDGVVKKWILNENGYWVTDTNYNMRVVDIVNIQGGVQVKIAGNGVMGQWFNFKQYYDDQGYVRLLETEISINHNLTSTEATVDYLVDGNEGTMAKVSADTFIFYDTDRQTSNTVVNWGAGGATMTNYVNFIVDQAKNDDIIKIQFTSKGGENRIKFPEISELSNNGEGQLRLKFKHGGNYTAVFDDIYMNMDQNNDVYTASLDAKKASKEEYELKISSGYSGFVLSSYMNSFSNSNECMYYSRFGETATLTEHFARDVIRVKGEPYQKIDNEYQGMTTPFNSFGNLMALASCSYNAHNDTTQSTMIEVKINNLIPTIEHKGSNDENQNS